MNKQELLADYLAWSGGFPPASKDDVDIEVYLLLTCPTDVDTDQARMWLHEAAVESRPLFTVTDPQHVYEPVVVAAETRGEARTLGIEQMCLCPVDRIDPSVVIDMQGSFIARRFK